MSGRTGWIRRRKETADLISESLLRHTLSLDFTTAELPVTDLGDTSIAFVPVTLLRKEPGSFTRFDFVDESGRSIPVADRDRNATVSAGVLAEAARRTLNRPITSTLGAELALIARSDKDLALAIVTGAYESPEGPITQDPDAQVRQELWTNARFRWLLRTLARSSVLVAALPLDNRPRRIIKLSYDESIQDVTALRRDRWKARAKAIAHRFGWLGYQLAVYSPFIGAASYHFELHAPEGMQLLRAGLDDGTEGKLNRRRVHLYVATASKKESSVAWAQFRVRGPGFTGAAAMTSLLIFLALAGAYWQAPQLKDTNTSAPALLLLFPGLVGSYLARPSHPLVTRLLNLARWTMVLCAGVAYLGAARLAIVTQAHTTSTHALRVFFFWSAAAALLATLVLLGSWRLPRALKQPPAPTDS